MKIGDFDLSLKSIIIIAFVLIVIIGIFSFTGNGGDVSVYGVGFHIPDGYNEVKEQEVDGVGESYEYINNENHDVIFITVKDTNASDISQLRFNYPSVKQHTVIDGKEGLLAMTSGTGVRNHFFYIENGKLIHINAPFTDVGSGLSDEELLAQIIK